MSRKPRRFAKAPRRRKVAGQMNKTEEEYSERLNVRRAAGEVLAFWYENMTLKLANDVRYTPDFFVMLADGSLEVHEVKGTFIRDDARVKLRAAAERYPFRFYMAQRLTKKLGGGWNIEEIPSDTWMEVAA